MGCGGWGEGQGWLGNEGKLHLRCPYSLCRGGMPTCICTVADKRVWVATWLARRASRVCGRRMISVCMDHCLGLHHEMCTQRGFVNKDRGGLATKAGLLGEY